MAACKVDLSNLIIAEANRQGVDPGIALAVARTESGVCQWRPDGSVVVSSAGAIGVMQLEPATAAQLGVDPNDVNQNIQGGITFLKQLYQKYGSWDQALAAYNWGGGNVDKAAAAGTSWPGEVLNYVKGILGIGTVYNAALNKMNSSSDSTASTDVSSADILSNLQTTPSMNVNLVAALAIGGFAIALVWFGDD